MAAPMYNVYVGSETGLLKGINVSKGHWNNLNSIGTADKSKEICSICWEDNVRSELCIGLRNKCIISYDTKTKLFSEPIPLDGGKGNLRSVLKCADSHITAIDTGLVHVWTGGEQVTEINSGEHLHCMSQNKKTQSVLGTGGKETDLKIWDVNNPDKPTFIAKNVKNDWLNLRVPVWITGIDFLSNDKVVTCTGHHQVRIYDPVAQRRPVLDMKFDEYPITAMSLHSDHQMIVGNTQGKMALLDLRKGSMVHLFKGFAGAIRSVQCHSSKSIVASCGLDRFLRIHDINSKQMLHKVYLKSRLNCVLMTDKWTDDKSGEVSEGVAESQESTQEDEEDSGENEDVDEDDLWNKMEVVKTKTFKKKETNVQEHTEEKKKRKHVEQISIAEKTTKKKRKVKKK